MTLFHYSKQIRNQTTGILWDAKDHESQQHFPPWLLATAAFNQGCDLHNEASRAFYFTHSEG